MGTCLGFLLSSRSGSFADGIEISVDTATRLEGSWRLEAAGDASMEARRGQDWTNFDLVPAGVLQGGRQTDPACATAMLMGGWGPDWDRTPDTPWTGAFPVYLAACWTEFVDSSSGRYHSKLGGPDIEWAFWDVRWEGGGSEFRGRFRFVAVPVPWEGEVKWRHPEADAVFVAPTDVVLEASVTVHVGTVAAVRFYDGDTLLRTVDEPPFLFRWNNVPEGPHDLVAVAIDDHNEERASDRVRINVRASASEPTHEVHILDAVVQEAADAATNLAFEVFLSKPLSERIAVRYATVAGTATAGTDFLSTSGTLVFEPGVSQLLLAVTVLPDETREPDETLTLVLSEPIAAVLGREQATGVIRDEPIEAPREVSLPILSVADTYVIVEESGIHREEARFRARLSVAGSRPVRVDYATRDGTTDAMDYTPASGTLFFPPGITEQTVTVAVLANGLDEAVEWFALELSNPQECHLATWRATCQVYDESPPPTVSAMDVVVAEGDVDSEATAHIPLILSRPSGHYVEVGIGTTAGTAREMDWGNPEPGVSDFIGLWGTAGFQPGQTETFVDVLIASDTFPEPNETFQLGLGTALNGTVARGIAVVTIVNDEPEPAISICDASVQERFGGTTNLTFEVRLSKPATAPVEAYYVTEDGTASPDTDFTPTSGWIRIEPGATNAEIQVAILPDAPGEPAETLHVRLGAPMGGVLAQKHGTGTILDRFNLTPTVVLTAPAAGSTYAYGEPVVCTASTYDPESRVVRVEFISGRMVLGTASTAPFTWTCPALPLGQHSVSARVMDETGASSSSEEVRIEVLEASPLRWLAPQPGARVNVGEPTRLATTLEVSGFELRQVEFLVNEQLLGSADAPPFEIAWTPGAAGMYSVRAVGWDTRGGVWRSDPLTITAALAMAPNDAFAAAAPLVGFQAHVETSNESASREPDEPLHHAAESGGSLWYRWTSPGDGSVSVRVLGPAETSGMAAFYTGAAVGTLTLAQSVTGTGTFAVMAGESFCIALDTLEGERGSIRFDLLVSDVQWGQPANGAVLAAPVNVVLQAAMNGPAEAIREVAYFRGSEFLGAATAAPFAWVWSNTPNGYHELWARTMDVLGGERTSPLLRLTVRPENDEFERATALNGYRVRIQASNEAATYQGAYVRQDPPLMGTVWVGEPRYGDNQGGHSIWYRWTAPEDGLCMVSGDIAGSGALLGAYVGTRVDQLRFVGSNPFEPRGTALFFPVTGGTDYYVAFDGLFGEEGPLAGGVEWHPKNDDFERRTHVGSERFEVIASHRGASLEGAAEAVKLGHNREVSVWWEWTPPNADTARVVCQSAGGKTRVAVFTGDKLAELVLQGLSGDAPSNPAVVTFQAEAGVAYQIAVLGEPPVPEDFTLQFLQPRLRIVSPLPVSAHAEPASFELAAVMDADPQPDQVEYYLGTEPVGHASMPPFAVSVRGLPAGTYTLTGVARFASGAISTSGPVAVLVYRNHDIPMPRIFRGPAGLASHVINALGEHRSFGRGSSGFGLQGPNEWSRPRLGRRPSGVEAWLAIQSGGNGESWALSSAGELFLNGEQPVAPPDGVTRWVKLRTGLSGALLVGDDERIYHEGRQLLPFALQGKHWTDIAAGQRYHCTLDETGTAYMHTLDDHAQSVTQVVPFPGETVRRWVQMAGGVYVVLLKGDDEQLYEATPFGPWGQYQATVTPVANPPGVNRWLEFAAGGFHAMAIGSDGHLYTWGRNAEGQLGIGGAGWDQPILQRVTPPPGVTAWTAVAAGYMHSLAVGNDCALYAWGRNVEGQLGIGPVPSPTLPARVDNLGVLCAFPVVYQDARPTLLEDGRFRLRFTSDLNRAYLIQYSADARTWHTAATPLVGNGGVVEWTDAGPPETESLPATIPERFYRIVFAP